MYTNKNAQVSFIAAQIKCQVRNNFPRDFGNQEYKFSWYLIQEEGKQSEAYCIIHPNTQCKANCGIMNSNRMGDRETNKNFGDITQSKYKEKTVWLVILGDIL